MEHSRAISPPSEISKESVELLLKPYGYCPGCGAPGKTRREGFDTCENQHQYPTKHALDKPQLLHRIKFDPTQHGGWPYILGPVVTIQAPGSPPVGSHQMILVSILLQLIANGMPEEKLLQDIHWLEKEDIDAAKLWWKNLIKLGMSYET